MFHFPSFPASESENPAAVYSLTATSPAKRHHGSFLLPQSLRHALAAGSSAWTSASALTPPAASLGAVAARRRPPAASRASHTSLRILLRSGRCHSSASSQDWSPGLLPPTCLQIPCVELMKCAASPPRDCPPLPTCALGLRCAWYRSSFCSHPGGAGRQHPEDPPARASVWPPLCSSVICAQSAFTG